MKIRSIVLLICFVLCASFLIGCVTRSPAYNNLDTDTFYANMKPVDTNFGKKAAVYENRIYYLSAENGKQGIHSMRPDGSDVRLEFETEDIRSLTVQADGFYYAGYSHIGTNENGAYRCFRLFHRASAKSRPIDLLSDAENIPLLKDNNVWDFYIAQNGSIYFRGLVMDWYFGSNDLLLSTLSNGMILEVADYPIFFANSDAMENCDVDESLVIYRHEDRYAAVTKDINGSAFPVQISDEMAVTLYDSVRYGTVLPYDSLFLGGHERWGVSRTRWILRLSDSEILLAYDGEICKYDFSQGVSRTISSFPTTESIYSTYDDGANIYMMTKTYRRAGWIRSDIRRFLHIPTKAGETLYRLSPETGERTSLLTLKGDAEFLYINDEVVATAKDRTISIYDITTDTPVLLKTIELEHKIVDRANKVDTAGGWLFLYGFNEKTQRDELLEKVYIGS